MAFFDFNQNNSGGGFSFEAGAISHHVVIEAEDYKAANEKAEAIGLYFNGCDTGQDCSCCGDRWSKQWSSDRGDEKPSVYGDELPREEEGFIYESTWGSWMGDKPEGYVHYQDGTVVPIYVRTVPR